jgi:hypothetical protein
VNGDELAAILYAQQGFVVMASGIQHPIGAIVRENENNAGSSITAPLRIVRVII